MMNPQIDKYLEDGCGRCSKYATPDCKVNTWRDELVKLRSIVLECGLTEDLKWSMPCYTLNNKNVCMVTAFKEYCCISFFKGSLLKDEDGLLESPGESSQAFRQIRITEKNRIAKNEASIKALIFQAIEVEKAGKKVSFKRENEPVPEEFQKRLDKDAQLKRAFEGLTPGRQRAYILFFTQPKQSSTRESRIDKNIDKILAGVGLYDDYKC